jgi:hypothetical protein
MAPTGIPRRALELKSEGKRHVRQYRRRCFGQVLEDIKKWTGTGCGEMKGRRLFIYQPM